MGTVDAAEAVLVHSIKELDSVIDGTCDDGSTDGCDDDDGVNAEDGDDSDDDEDDDDDVVLSQRAISRFVHLRFCSARALSFVRDFRLLWNASSVHERVVV